MFSSFASQVHLLAYLNKFLYSSAISINLLFLPVRMARTGNTFSIVANILLMLGERRDQVLLLTSTKTQLFFFF